jgi:hypothetical protein
MFSISRTLILAPAALALTIGLATPAAAQRGQNDEHRRAAPRSEQRAPASRPAPQAERRTAPNASRPPAVRPQAAPPARFNNVPHAQPRREAPRVYDSRPNVRSYAVPRPYVAPRYNTPYRGYGRPYVSRRPVFVRPYYAFRPRFTFGFGLSVGFGVPYPFTYYDPYAPYNFDVAVVPGYVAGNSSAYYSRVGGLSFNIDPMDAAVFLDGQYVGTAEDFAPDQMPLTLPVGRHHVDLRADGFMTASFDITIVGGQVIPYEGTLAQQ